MKLLRVILILLASLKFICTKAQDIHFSQFNGSLLNVSAGHAGLFNGDYRVGAIYRSQWSSVPVSYSTFSMHGEVRLKPPAFKKDMIGAGFLFNSDRAGDTRYGTNQIYFNPSYIYLAKPDSSLIITLGVNIGFCNVGFDYSKMTFDNQYNGFEFDKTQASGENFEQTQKNFADVNMGSVLQYIHERGHRITYAVGVNHISRPVITYQGYKASRLDLKIVNCISYSKPVGIRSEFIAEALLTNQGKSYELLPHLSLKYYINKHSNQAVIGGACYRARDAAIVRFGYTHNTLQSGIAYDINVSGFSPATNRRGGFEIFINYVFKRASDFVAKKRSCPVFM